VDSNFNFCVDVHMGLDSPLPVHMRPPELSSVPCGRHNWMAPKRVARSELRRTSKSVFSLQGRSSPPSIDAAITVHCETILLLSSAFYRP